MQTCKILQKTAFITEINSNQSARLPFSLKTRQAYHKVLGNCTHCVCATDTRVVFTLLPSTSAVRDAFLGTDGITRAQGGIKPSLFIDCSTMSPAASREIAREVERSSLHHSARPFPGLSAAHPAFVDAPVSGELTAASAATLTFMVHASFFDSYPEKKYWSIWVTGLAALSRDILARAQKKRYSRHSKEALRTCH